MFALTYAEFGDPSVLQVTTVEEPHAGPGQVRIAVRTAGVNPADWKFRSGMFKDFFPTPLPSFIGMEAAGVVDEVGEGVEGVAVGDEVFGLGQGTIAEFALLDHFALKPAGMSWEQAGGLATVSETAVRALEIISPASGQTLLIDGAAGGVGGVASQFAIADGVIVIGTASEPNHDFLRSLGVVPTTYGPGLEGRVAALAPAGVDAAFDVAGKGSLKELVELTGAPDKVVTIADFTAAEHGVQLTSQTSAYHALEKAARLFEEGRLTVTIDSEFALADAAKAHERSESGHVRGKIVLRVSEA
ncbi:oxidoreductase [Planotetraspora thailandica]|uniref:Oxidoreductase n=1 Tax=Planotetraspora thailandica TaxID=487172 RepID=A0A8J3XZY7_9ACTN|nr:NADP-dependent oxidoreductase [Planotetraspora thailandica]GII58263.1 oxidoreductase [Planotetraspora thailandica]